MTEYKNRDYCNMIHKFREDNLARNTHYSEFEIDRQKLQRKALKYAGKTSK